MSDDYIPSKAFLELDPIFAQRIDEKRKAIAKLQPPEEVRKFQEDLLGAFHPACEYIDWAMQRNPSFIIWKKKQEDGKVIKEEYQHDLLNLMDAAKAFIFEIIAIIQKEGITAMQALPEMITQNELRMQQQMPDDCSYYDDAEDLMLAQAKRIMVVEAVGKQLGIEKQLISHYMKHSPLFIHPKNIALRNSSVGLPGH